MPSSEIRIVDTLAGVQDARDAWKTLWHATEGATTFQHPDYAAAVLTTMTGDVAPAILLAFADGKLQAVWPLQIVRSRGVRHVLHLHNGSREEYADPLFAADADDGVVARMFSAAKRLGDVLELYNLASEGRIWAHLPSDRPSLRALRSDMACLTVQFATAGSWEAWLAGKSKSFRQGLRYDRKRLSAKGTLAFVAPTSADTRAEQIRWTMANKYRWVLDHDIAGSWLAEASATAFFETLVTSEDGIGATFGLRLDDTLIASCLCLIGKRDLEFFLTTYDEAWAAYSPGNLLVEEVVRWCFERRLNFDMRFPVMDYKRRWSDHARTCHGYLLATTLRGTPFLWAKHAARMRSGLKRRAKAVVTHLRARRKGAGQGSA
ncbi:GNAT family N-acetyltransferase [uncultured Sphingomonas sp.]|uniref:GNAT family N-acetyltransferase n=1 Tax=uncultured Sphingomonas sp. TaxID=158754 RepID=UPI0025E4C383|nr:GNAT family N-acetyltransferase [uncultured Sphingomonas sp.]